MATKAFKPQTHLLEPGDLGVTYACIQAYFQSAMHELSQSLRVGRAYPTTPRQRALEEGMFKRCREREGLFAFFNSGLHSGASQPHRHVQLLPVAKMKEGEGEEGRGGLLTSLEDGDGAGDGTTAEKRGRRRWDVLADKIKYDEDGDGGKFAQKLPFRVFSDKIHEGMTPADLHAVYLRLYRRAVAAVKAYEKGSAKEEEGEEESVEVETEGEAAISYNMAMTRDVMVIMPRIAEGADIVHEEGGGGDGKEKTKRTIGKLALNGTVLAGTALVKNQAEWDTLRAHPEMVVDLLGRIGLPVVKSSL